MDLIKIWVNPNTHEIQILTDSPQSRIDRFWTEIDVVLPPELKEYSVRLNFELPIKRNDGTVFYPFVWLTGVPYVVPPKILLAANNQVLPVRVFLTRTDPITGVKESFASGNVLNLEVNNARKMEIDDPGWLMDLGYEDVFRDFYINFETREFVFIRLNGNEKSVPYDELIDPVLFIKALNKLTPEEASLIKTLIGAVSVEDFEAYKTLAANTYHKLSGSNFEWNKDRCYTKNAIVRYGNDLFLSIASKNKGHDPAEFGSLWWIRYSKPDEKVAKLFVIGDTVNTVFTVRHNFGTQVFFSALLELTEPFEYVGATIKPKGLDEAVITFANPPNANSILVALSPTGNGCKGYPVTVHSDMPTPNDGEIGNIWFVKRRGIYQKKVSEVPTEVTGLRPTVELITENNQDWWQTAIDIVLGVWVKQDTYLYTRLFNDITLTMRGTEEYGHVHWTIDEFDYNGNKFNVVFRTKAMAGIETPPSGESQVQVFRNDIEGPVRLLVTKWTEYTETMLVPIWERVNPFWVDKDGNPYVNEERLPKWSDLFGPNNILHPGIQNPLALSDFCGIVPTREDLVNVVSLITGDTPERGDWAIVNGETDNQFNGSYMLAGDHDVVADWIKIGDLTLTWDEIAGKPVCFPGCPHTHLMEDITDLKISGGGITVFGSFPDDSVGSVGDTGILRNVAMLENFGERYEIKEESVYGFYIYDNGTIYAPRKGWTITVTEREPTQSEINKHGEELKLVFDRVYSHPDGWEMIIEYGKFINEDINVMLISYPELTFNGKSEKPEYGPNASWENDTIVFDDYSFELMPAWDTIGTFAEKGAMREGTIRGEIVVKGNLQEWLDENFNRHIFNTNKDRLNDSGTLTITLDGEVENGWGLVIDNVFLDDWMNVNIIIGANISNPNVYMVLRNIRGDITFDTSNLEQYCEFEIVGCSYVTFAGSKKIQAIKCYSSSFIELAQELLPKQLDCYSGSTMNVYAFNSISGTTINGNGTYIIDGTTTDNFAKGMFKGMIIDNRTGHKSDTFIREIPPPPSQPIPAFKKGELKGHVVVDMSKGHSQAWIESNLNNRVFSELQSITFDGDVSYINQLDIFNVFTEYGMSIDIITGPNLNNKNIGFRIYNVQCPLRIVNSNLTYLGDINISNCSEVSVVGTSSSLEVRGLSYVISDVPNNDITIRNGSTVKIEVITVSKSINIPIIGEGTLIIDSNIPGSALLPAFKGVVEDRRTGNPQGTYVRK